MADTTSTQQSLGVTLLLLDRVLAAQVYEGQTLPLAFGACSVDLVSLSSTAEDAYLLLKIDADAEGKTSAKDGFEMVLTTDQIVKLTSAGQGTRYEIPSADVPGAIITLTLPPGSTEEEAFQEIIEQYCGLVREGNDERGRVELVDEKGNVIGSLDRSIQPTRSSDGITSGDEPVLLLADDDASSFYSTSEYPGTTTSDPPTATSTKNAASAPALPRASAAQEKDWLINGAQYVSKGLIGVSGWLGGSVEKGANRYASGKNSGASTPLNANATDGPDRYLDDKSSTGLNSQALSTDYQSGPGYGAGPTSSSSCSAMKSKTNVPIHPSISKGLSALSSGSGHVVTLSHSARKLILDTSDKAGRRLGGVRGGTNKDGTPRQPGAVRTQLQRGAQAANIVLDGFDTAVGGLLTSVGTSGGRVVGHTFGPQAQTVSGHIGQVGKNCFLVYKDVSGVRRKCLLKLAGGTLKGRTVDGQEIEISANPEEQQQQQQQRQGGGGDNVRQAIGAPDSSTGSAHTAHVSGKVPPPPPSTGSTSTNTTFAPPSYSEKR